MSSKKNWGRILLSGASLAAMGAMSPAMAQTAAPDTSDEIVVTATGRSAAIQDVPLAVTALSSDTLQNAGVADVRDLQQLAPSYRFFTGQSTVAGTTAYVRGIGTGADSPGFESAVGFFIDGVYRNRSGIAMGDLPEVERIEVLRGPQGTLFGRNTSAGAISIVTAAPEFDTHAWLSGTTGNLGLISGNAGWEGALIQDKLAVRLDLAGTARDGYIHDVNTGRDYDDRNRWSARGQALWDINSSASLRVIADWAEEDENCCTAVTIQESPTAVALVDALASAIGADGLINPVNPSSFNAAFSPNRTYNETVKDRGISAQLNVDLGFADLTSITSYRNWEATRKQDIDFSGLDRAYRDGWENQFETTTEEVRLHGQHGIVDWLVGGFYIHENLALLDTIRLGTEARAFVDTLAASQNVSPVPGQQYPGLPAGADGLTEYGPAGSAIAGFDAGTCLPIFTPGTNIFQAAAALGQWQAHISSGCATAQAFANGTYTNPALQGFANALNATAPVNGQGQTDRWGTSTEGFALFTHDEINLSDNLVWTVGARWNHEEKDLSAFLNSSLTSCSVFRAAALNPALAPVLQSSLSSLVVLGCNPAVNNEANGTYEDTHSENAWSGTTSLAYHVDPNLMLYGSYSRGYKSGGFNIDRQSFLYTLNSCAPPTSLCTLATPSTSQLLFKPEFVDAFEVGFKSTLFGGTTFLNADVFLEKIHDYQENAFSGFNFITFNVPEAISKGVEVDLLARPTQNLTIQSGLLYNDAYIDSTVLGATGNVLVNKGDQFSQAPKQSATVAVTYELPITNDLRTLFSVDARYNSDYPTQTIAPVPVTHQQAYTLVNARIGVGAQNGRWELDFWAKNLTDEFYYIGGFAVPEQSSLGVYGAYPGEPRTYGATLRARF